MFSHMESILWTRRRKNSKPMVFQQADDGQPDTLTWPTPLAKTYLIVKTQKHKRIDLKSVSIRNKQIASRVVLFAQHFV